MEQGRTRHRPDERGPRGAFERKKLQHRVGAYSGGAGESLAGRDLRSACGEPARDEPARRLACQEAAGLQRCAGSSTGGIGSSRSSPTPTREPSGAAGGRRRPRRRSGSTSATRARPRPCARRVAPRRAGRRPAQRALALPRSPRPSSRRRRIGSFNLHPGPLPGFPGLNAPSWAIYERRARFGCTVHWMDAAIDAGLIAYEAASRSASATPASRSRRGAAARASRCSTACSTTSSATRSRVPRRSQQVSASTAAPALRTAGGSTGRCRPRRSRRSCARATTARSARPGAGHGLAVGGIELALVRARGGPRRVGRRRRARRGARRRGRRRSASPRGTNRAARRAARARRRRGRSARRSWAPGARFSA